MKTKERKQEKKAREKRQGEKGKRDRTKKGEREGELTIGSGKEVCKEEFCKEDTAGFEL